MRKKEVPLSQDTRKITTPLSLEECIAELRRIAEANPDRVVTRNFFRVHSRFAESVWNANFGTFLEFKRQANIILSRHAHTLEKAIAKHASKDVQRKMNEEKSGWEDKYLRPSNKRWQTALVGSDIHDKLCDPFYRRLFVDTARRVQPEKIVLNGDIFDMTEFSKYTQDPRQFDVVGRIKWVHAFLDDLRHAAPNSEVTLCEGNHEFRLLRHLTEATPALVTVLSDLHGMSIPDLLGLTKYEVNYVARADLSAFNESDIKKELNKNYMIFWDALLCHHFPHGRLMGYPGTNGHEHKHLVWSNYSPAFGSYEWHQTGCGHIRSAIYTAAERWSNGFLLAHVDTKRKRTQMEYLDTTFEGCMIGGRFYQREKDELVAA
jgi:hypothetical protein